MSVPLPWIDEHDVSQKVEEHTEMGSEEQGFEAKEECESEQTSSGKFEAKTRGTEVVL